MANPFNFLINPGQQFGSGLGSIFGGLFDSDPGRGYKDAANELQKYFGQASEYQMPFYNAGKNAIPGFQEWLDNMKDPSQFINNLEGQYQESPHARYLQDQAIRAATNAGSASGLTGSTPLMKQMQENASNISSGDMNQWLSNVLGINTQYGQFLDTLMGRGQNSANQLTNLMTQLGQLIGGAKMGEANAERNRYGDIFGGLGSMIGSFF
jgi:hypothetical protein